MREEVNINKKKKNKPDKGLAFINIDRYKPRDLVTIVWLEKTYLWACLAVETKPHKYAGIKCQDEDKIVSKKAIPLYSFRQN